MAATRKLQGEIDRCLKRVTEGVEVFEDIWVKVHNATNANQKEKYEADLKKEIKKLQRLRDQIKSWLASGEVKDKSVLLDNRRLIETQMERFKVVERETKTKAYSKEGLGAAQKLDPAQKERDDANNWLSQSIESLQIQTDKFDSEIESLQVCTKKKKQADKEKTERIDRLKMLLDSHNDHIKKLEMVMRLLDNESITVEQVNKLRDDVDYYIESAVDPDYQENLYIYDDINFEELNHNALEVGTADSGADQDNDGISGINTGSTPSVSSSSPVPSLSAIGTGSTNSHHSMNDEIHPTIVNEKKRHRSSESENSGKRTGSVTASSTGSNSHGGVNSNSNSSPLMSASITPPPSQQNSTTHSQSPLTVVPSSPAKPSLSVSNSTPNNSSSSSGTNGPVNHIDGKVSPPASRFAMMNGTSMASIVAGSISLPSTPQLVQQQAQNSGASSASGISGSGGGSSGPPANSNVVRQLFQTQPASSATANASSSSRDEKIGSPNLAVNLIPALNGPSVTTSVPNKSEVTPLFGLAKEAVLNAQQQHQHQQQQLQLENDKKGLDILSSLMDNIRTNSTAPARPQPPSSSALQTSLSSSLASLTASMSTSVTTTNAQLPVGLQQLGGGPDKASIAAFMAENKLNTLPGASTPSSMPQHILQSNILSNAGQQQPAPSSSSNSTADLIATSINSFGSQSSSSQPSSSASASSGLTSSASLSMSSLSGLVSSVQTSVTSGETRISSTLAVNPTGPVPLTKENQVQLQLLEFASFRLPLQSDGERSRLIPRTHYAGLPLYYPQVVPMTCDTMEFFSRLSTETLFFIFYYMEGTKAQYFAAKALKKQSWRFHTRYLMWFQRHEEPKTITDEYEQGAYIYFDFEKWSQRKKEGFTFEYRFLEDRELN